MFDYRLLLHAINTLPGIVYEIKLARMLISLQRIYTVLVEKNFGQTRMHAGVQQTVVELIKATDDDDAIQFIYVQNQVKNRPLACGETIPPSTYLTGIGIAPLTYVEAVVHIIEFPATISPLPGERTTDEFHIFAEKLIGDALLPFSKTNFNMMSARKQRSPYREFHSVAPSSRPIILSSKSEMRGVIRRTALDPIKQHLGALLGRPRVLSEELKLLVVEACEAADIPFEGAHALNQSTKR